jgi:hypothetical protein
MCGEFMTRTTVSSMFECCTDVWCRQGELSLKSCACSIASSITASIRGVVDFPTRILQDLPEMTGFRHSARGD